MLRLRTLSYVSRLNSEPERFSETLLRLKGFPTDTAPVSGVWSPSSPRYLTSTLEPMEKPTATNASRPKSYVLSSCCSTKRRSSV